MLNNLCELKQELKRSVWDYSIDENTLLQIFQGKTQTFSLNRTKICSRLLLNLQWYKLLDLLGIDGVKQLLTDDILKLIWIKDVREKYYYAQQILNGIS